MSCEFAQTTVHGYFDDELDAVRSAEFEGHLESCTQCQDGLREMQSLRRQLQRGDLCAHASPRLLHRIRKQTAQEANRSRLNVFSGRRLFLIPALGTLAATAATVALVLFMFQSRAQSTRITAELIDAHVRSLQPGHLTDVLSTDQHTVKPWFAGKVDFIPPASDFSQQGFPLVGGRLDTIDGHNVATLVYSRRKHFMNLFVWPYREKATNLAGSGSHQGYNWLRWQGGDMQFCLISDASPAELRELKGLIGQ